MQCVDSTKKAALQFIEWQHVAQGDCPEQAQIGSKGSWHYPEHEALYACLAPAGKRSLAKGCCTTVQAAASSFLPLVASDHTLCMPMSPEVKACTCLGALLQLVNYVQIRNRMVATHQ
jgi:hypothetical protein